MKKLSWQGQRILDNSHRSLHSVAEEKDRERISIPAPISSAPSSYKTKVFFDGGADFFSRQTADVHFNGEWEEVSSKDEAEAAISSVSQRVEYIPRGPEFYSSSATAVEPKVSEIGGEDLKKYLDEKGEIE